MKVGGRETKASEIREIKRWPVIILIASRRAKVRGRINILIVSMITIKGTKR